MIEGILLSCVILSYLWSAVVAQPDGCYSLGDFVAPNSIRGVYDTTASTTPEVGPTGTVNTWAAGEGPENVLDGNLSTIYRPAAVGFSGILFEFSKPLLLSGVEFFSSVDETERLYFNYFWSSNDTLDVSALNPGDRVPEGVFENLRSSRLAFIPPVPVR